MSNDESELMNQVRMLHVEFVVAAENASLALSKLLNAIDNEGTDPDYLIEKQHGAKVLNALKIANKAWAELEVFVPVKSKDETE